MTNEELSLRTRKSLAAALKKAMEKKPLSKITVTELITECNINRKTFYYHFQDIYDLLKWMFEQEAIEVVKNFDLIVNTEEAIRFVMNYVNENKHIICCAYDSMGHEAIKSFFYTDLFGITYSVIEDAENRLNIVVDKSFKEFFACFLTNAAAGILVDWVKNSINMDSEIVLQDILLIYRASITNVLVTKSEKTIG
ncbi:MAG: TetR/AcrR family transcriptional regulator C-terminal domain-containing protein [Butyrivibrio sp.]